MDGAGYGTTWTNLDPDNKTWHPVGWNAPVFDPIRKLYGPSNNTYTHTANGVGNIYGVGGTTAVTGNIFLRGGNLNNGAVGGVFTLDLDRASVSTGGAVGFRCAR